MIRIAGGDFEKGAVVGVANPGKASDDRLGAELFDNVGDDRVGSVFWDVAQDEGCVVLRVVEEVVECVLIMCVEVVVGWGWVRRGGDKVGEGAGADGEVDVGIVLVIDAHEEEENDGVGVGRREGEGIVARDDQALSGAGVAEGRDAIVSLGRLSDDVECLCFCVFFVLVAVVREEGGGGEDVAGVC